MNAADRQNDADRQDDDSPSSEPPTLDDSPTELANERLPAQKWMRVSGLGVELASFTLVLALIGHWVDTRRGHEQGYCTAIGALVGFTYGMFRFIRRALDSIKD